MRHMPPSGDNPRGASRIEVVLALFLATNVLAILGCALNQAPSNSARMNDTNNLKQIGLAVHGFHDVNRKFPYNGTAEVYENNKSVKLGGHASVAMPGSGSYAYQVLPYVEQQALYNTQTGGGSGPLAAVPTYLSPARMRRGFANVAFHGAQTDYHLNPYLNAPDLLNNLAGDPQACGQKDGNKTLGQVKDGSSNTILIGHGYFNTADYNQQDGSNPYFSSIYRGGEQCTCRVAAGANPNEFRQDGPSSPTSGWGSPYPQGGFFVLCDGSIHMFPYGTNLTPFLDPDDGVAVMLP